jgi:hypothetical protein
MIHHFETDHVNSMPIFPRFDALAAKALLGTCIMWQANTWLPGRLIFQRGVEAL